MAGVVRTVLVARNLDLPDFLHVFREVSQGLKRGPILEPSDNRAIEGDDTNRSASPHAGRQPALTGCPWHDVNEMLQTAGLRPTRQRMALGWLLFGKGARHLTAEMLYEEATLAKVPV